MARTDVLDDLELIIDDIGRRGGDQPPGRGDGGKGGGHDRGRNHPWGTPSPRRYATAIALAMISILMFFMAMSAAFIILRTTSHKWVTFQLPWILWVNTAVLLTSSVALELARHRLSSGNSAGFRKLWLVTTILGFLFLGGQLFAWQILVAEGVFVDSTLSSSFFYVITAAHGLHLFGGVCALLFVAFRNFNKTRVTRALAAEVVSYYWHFMDGLWVFLFLLLYFGR